jgi:hypothetical protein
MDAGRQGIGVCFFASSMGTFVRALARKNRAFRSNSCGISAAIPCTEEKFSLNQRITLFNKAPERKR